MATPKEIPDDLWNESERVIPPRPSRERGGRPPANDRVLLNGMLYILRTGAPWREMPEKYDPWQTVYDRFAEWKKAGVFEQIWRKCQFYEQKDGIQWTWQNGDGTYVRSPLGEKENGPNPTDRAKPGLKDHVLVDGRGVPLSVVVTPANVNDRVALPVLLANHVMVRPQPRQAAPQHLCLDAALDNAPTRRLVCREYYVAQIAPKSGRPDDAPVHPGGQARR